MADTQTADVQQRIDTAIADFIAELKKPAAETDWEKCGSNDRVSVWRKFEEDSGLYRLKIVGKINAPQEIVHQCLFDHKLRLAWDTVLESIREIETTANGSPILHITARSPPMTMVANRDFVHIRTYRDTAHSTNKGETAKVIVDISVDHPQAPEVEGVVRATTLLSGGILESTLIPNMATKGLDNGTTYYMISHVDLKGYIPKTIVNLVSANATLAWFESLAAACEKHKQGQLTPKA
jgi:hypothetical protein